jgi:hypothetical protein
MLTGLVIDLLDVIIGLECFKISLILTSTGKVFKLVASFKGRPKFSNEKVREAKVILGDDYIDVRHIFEGPKRIVWILSREDILALFMSLLDIGKFLYFYFYDLSVSPFWIIWKAFAFVKEMMTVYESVRARRSSVLALRALAVSGPEQAPDSPI